MPGNPQASVYIGNVDENVDERVLYEIMVQAGPLVDVYMPRDKETRRHKGYGFAEFTTEKSAQYAVNLFSGLVHLHKKPLRISISGQEKGAQSPPQEARDTTKQTDLDSRVKHSQKPRMPVCSPPVGYNSSPLGGFGKGSFTGYRSAPVHSGLAVVGQRLDFVPLAYAQDYNARLVSLDQAGLESRLRIVDRSFAY